MVRDRGSEQFPSTYWYGDKYQCPVCGFEVVTGFGEAISGGSEVENGEEVLEFVYNVIKL